MTFHLISVFPKMLEEALKWGVVGKAFEKDLAHYDCIDPRQFTNDAHKTIDDRPFGGGDGMVMLYEPLSKAIESIANHKACKKIYLSPRGRLLNEGLVNELSRNSNFILLSGRYGGVDQRLLNQYEFEEVSVGDYVVSGGELPSLILIDALMRKVPGVLGNNNSSFEDSFAGGKGFEAPLFTRPQENEAGKVPDILLSGDHQKIAEFRRLIGLALTLKERPELVENTLSNKDKKKIENTLSQLSIAELQVLGLKK